MASLTAARSSGSAVLIRYANSSILDHPSPIVVGATGLKRTGYVADRQGTTVFRAVDLPISNPSDHPDGPRRAWSHFRNSRCSAWCVEKPADSSEYRHLKSVRRRTSCAVSTARTPTLASLASRAGVAVGLNAPPPVVPSSVISSPVVRWWY